MNDFLKNAMNVSMTENGALSYATTGSVCVDQFGKAGSYRGRDIEDVFKEQEELWNENKEFAIKFPFYLRMITRKTKLQNGDATTSVQRGQGARDESFKRLLWLAEKQPDLFYKNIWLLPIVGSWKDLWVLLTMCDSLDREKIYSVIAEGCQNETQRDLVKKYLPQIRSSKKCTTEWASKTNLFAKDFCKWAGWNSTEYRKFKSTGKAHEFQKFISTKQYDKLDWNKISGKALLNLSTGKFLSNQNLSESYIDWITQHTNVKFNGYAYELGRKLYQLRYGMNVNEVKEKITKMTVDAQFENLIKNGKEDNGAINGNVWCALDTSGSMCCKISKNSELSAFDVCVSLGIYFSTLNEGSFHKNVIMFDNESEIKQLSGTFSEMYHQITNSKTAWGGTNFQSVIDEIVRIRRNRPNIPLEDYPTTLLVISDMQFNSCGRYDTNYEVMKKKLYTAFPEDFVNSMKFIWWNVNANRIVDVPSTIDDGGCYFFSGFDGSVISLLLGGQSEVVDKETGEKRKPTMEEIIETTMNQEVLKLLVTE
jgi:hypothetical protein